MLQKLNERIQGVVSWIIVIIISITFAIFGIDYFLQNRHSAAAIEAKVNNQVISKRDYDINLRRILQMQDREGLSEVNEQAIKQQVLDDMISNVVTVQSAAKNGFLVTNDQANIAILSIPQFQEKGQFSNSRYSQALNNALYTHESFQEEVKKGMLINQQRFALVGTEFALPDELDKFVKLYTQKRDYQYLVIPANSFRDKVNVSEKDIEEYYNKHEKEYYYPEQISLQYVKISADDVRKKTQISEDKLLRHYEDNKSSYLSPAKWKVARILLKTTPEKDSAVKEKATNLAKYLQEHPEKFVEEYTKESDDKMNQDGTLPEIVAGDSDLDKYLLELTKPKQISEAIPTDEGYAIFKLLAYTPAKVRDFAEVRDSINEQLIVENVQNKYSELLEKLADLSYQTPDSLDMVSKLLNLEIMQTELFDKNGGNTELTKNKNLLKSAFSHEVLELGNNSEPVQIDNDSVIVLRVLKHIPASKMQLSNLKEEIRQLITEEQAQKLAIKFGEELIAKHDKLAQTTPVMISGKQIQWITVNDASRDNSQVYPGVNELAFSLAQHAKMAGKLISDGNYVVVSLNKVKDGSLNNLDKEQIASINQQLESSYGLMDYNLYINGLMQKAKVISSNNSNS